MSVHLQKPIEQYFAAENAGNLDDLDAYFATNAIVRDESHSHVGLAAIRQWKEEAKKKYSHTVEPLHADQRDGKIVVKGKVSGNFPGSPVTLEFHFALAAEKIVSLEIHG